MPAYHCQRFLSMFLRISLLVHTCFAGCHRRGTDVYVFKGVLNVARTCIRHWDAAGTLHLLEYDHYPRSPPRQLLQTPVWATLLPRESSLYSPREKFRLATNTEPYTCAQHRLLSDKHLSKEIRKNEEKSTFSV